jgi:hypothetical protein
MVLEIATVLLGVCVGAVAVLYAAPKGYFGHPKKKGSSTTTIESYAPATEQAVEVKAAEAPAVVEPAPSPAPEPEPAESPASAPEPEHAPTFPTALYETVQPAPTPVTFAPLPSTTISGHTFTKKPTRIYRRRTAPVRTVRNTVHTRAAKSKPKKR